MVKRGATEIFLILLICATILFFAVSINRNWSITGFAVYSGGCSNYINSGGYWELNASVGLCGNSTGVYINSSNVAFDCKNYDINGHVTQNAYGVLVFANLNNVSLENCDLLGFNNAIFVGSGSNLSVKNSSATSFGSCILGTWTDVSGNRGCLDVRGPEMNAINQTIYTNQTFNYQTVASDVSGISSYSVQYTGGNTTFQINNSGVIYNSSSLGVVNYSFFLIVNDTLGHRTNATFILFSLYGGTQTVNQSNSTQGTTESSGSSSGSSQGSGSQESEKPKEEKKVGTTAVKDEAASCTDVWQCGDWGECAVDGTRNRECERKRFDCFTRMPGLIENCTYVEENKENCVENWECTWSECLNGQRIATECKDLNSCGS
ncbi:MAG: hypothetical protein AABY05_02880, partial [Nanoarchaeota archaeon]